MKQENLKSKKQQEPIEQHNSAAWADTEKKKKVSNVTIPCETQVINAKEYVDSNQK